MQTWILLISHHNTSPGTGIMHLSNLPFADLQFASKSIPNIHTWISSLCFLIKPLLFIQSQLILHLNFWYILAHNTKHLAEHWFSWQPWTPIGINKEQRALFFLMEIVHLKNQHFRFCIRIKIRVFKHMLSSLL